MPRESGDRYHCDSCGAELVYEKPCPCDENRNLLRQADVEDPETHGRTITLDYSRLLVQT